MRKIISFLLLSFVVYALQAQIKDPVKFKTELTALSDTAVSYTHLRAHET